MLGLFFGGQKFQSTFGNQYGNIELDAMLDESHEWSAEATSNPVEDGAPVTDHVIEQADKLTIRGVVTDAPLNASSSILGFIGGGSADNKTQTVFDLLDTLIKKREVLTVYTKHKTYDDMVLTSVTIPRSASVGEAVEFSAEFIHIRKVATQTVDVPDGVSAKPEAKAGGAGGAVSKKASATKESGKKQAQTIKSPTKPATQANKPAADKVNRSVLKSIGNAGASALGF